MVGTQMILQKSVIFNQLRNLIARKDFVSRRLASLCCYNVVLGNILNRLLVRNLNILSQHLVDERGKLYCVFLHKRTVYHIPHTTPFTPLLWIFLALSSLLK
jgi:hypothetical protein